jgi:hypothetical protein
VDSGLFVSSGHDGKVIVWSTETFEPVEVVLPFRLAADAESGMEANDGNVKDIAIPPHGLVHTLIAGENVK